jgi:hypothetical protein
MDVSSSTTATTLSVDTMKKAMDAQEQQITSMIDDNQKQMQQMQDVQKQNQEMAAQKTGIGSNLNILG